MDNVIANTNVKLPYRWVMLILCWLIYVCFGLIVIALTAIVIPVSSDLNLSYSQMGFVLGTWQLVYTFVALPLGFLIDRIGTYKSLLIAIVAITASAVMRSFAVSFETLLFAVALFGIGGSMVSIGLPKVISIWFSGKERGTAIGIYVTGNMIGGIIALSLTNSVLIPFIGNWRNAYLVYGGFCLLIAAAWAFLGRKSWNYTVNAIIPVPVEEKGLSGARKAFSKNVLLVVLIGVTSFLVSHGLTQWLPTILQGNGLTPVQADYAVSMVNVFLILGTLLAPRLPSLVRSIKFAIIILLFIQGISVLAISETTGPALWTVLALRGLSGGFMPLLMLVLMDLPEVGSARLGSVTGLYFAIGEIGGFGGPSLMGFFKDATGTFVIGLIFLAVVCEAMIIPAFFLRIEHKREAVTFKTHQSNKM